MTDLELTTAFAAAFNQYDTSKMEPLIHDTIFHFYSQSSFNKFETKQAFLEFSARAMKAMEAAGIEIRAELAFTGDQSQRPMDQFSNITMWVRSGQPCISLVYIHPKPFEADYFVVELNENGEEELVQPMTQEQEFVVCFEFTDGLISEISFQLPTFHDCMRRTGEFPGR